MMLISEQYTLEQLREIFGVPFAIGWKKVVNAKIRDLKARNELMEFKPFSEPSRSRKRVRKFVFLAKQEALQLSEGGA
jgi:hypothetical protein